MTVDQLYAEGEKTLAAYDQAMACQSGHMADAKLIVIANYGDLCAGILRALLKARSTESSGGVEGHAPAPSDYNGVKSSRSGHSAPPIEGSMVEAGIKPGPLELVFDRAFTGFDAVICPANGDDDFCFTLVGAGTIKRQNEVAFQIVHHVNDYENMKADHMRLHNEKCDNFERAILAETQRNEMKFALEMWLAYADENLSEFDVGECDGDSLCHECRNSGCISLKIRIAREAIATPRVSSDDGARG